MRQSTKPPVYTRQPLTPATLLARTTKKIIQMRQSTKPPVYTSQPLTQPTTFLTRTTKKIIQMRQSTKPPVYTSQPLTKPATFLARTTRKIIQMRPPTQSSQHLALNPEDHFDLDNFECGISKYQASPGMSLLINGNSASRGQFPW
jgi:hypothetical protein